jgi:hypothetical protein
MKRIIFLIVVALCLFFTLTAESCYETDARTTAERAQNDAAKAAVTAVPIPTVTYFQEKKTIAKWASYWDKPSLATYVYLFAFDRCIGYFVSDGKPASTRSYIMPEEQYYSNGAVLSAPDIDGTWGDNNPGIRFFTASGIPVEWGGQGASYLYSSVPLKLNVPELYSKD